MDNGCSRRLSAIFRWLAGATSRSSVCVHRQGELKRGPARYICRGPQPPTVSFDDRTADRESHSHATRFGGEEGVEQPFRNLGGYPDAAIRHTDEHLLRLILSGSDHQFARPICDRLHRLNAIHHQVDHDLLQLDPITCDHVQGRCQFHLQRHLVADQFTLHQRDDLPYDFIDVERHPFNLGLVRECPDAPDHLARPIAVVYYPLYRATHRVQIRSSAIEPAETGFGVGYDTGERLIHFVGDGGCQLAQCRHPRYACELHLRIHEALFAGAQLLFRALALGDIAAHIPDSHRLPGHGIVDPIGRIVDRDRISGLEMAQTHLAGPETLLQHRRPEDGIHELTVFGEYVVKSAPRPRFFHAVQSYHFQPGLVHVVRRPSFEVGDRHEIGGLLNQ